MFDSPFSHLFDRNQAVDASDIPTIHDLLSKPLENLDRLNSEIARLEAVLAKLKLERDEAQNYVNAHQRLLSPSLRLPPEILSEIFVHCLPEDCNAICSVSEAPLLLGLICRNWRDVCISTSRLWSSIHIVIVNAHITRMCSEIDAKRLGVELWLERSGLSPLSFSIHGSCNEPGIMLSRCIQQFLQCFIQQVHRWQDVQLQLNAFCAHLFDASIATLPDLDQKLNLLHTLTFDFLSDIPTLPCLSKLLAAPHLRHVAVPNNIEHMQHHLELLSPGLSQLIIHGGSRMRTDTQPYNPLHLLLRYKSLRACHFEIHTAWRGVFDFTLSVPNIPLPLMRDLSFHFVLPRSTSIDDLFKRMSTPSLRRLKVRITPLPTRILEHAPFMPLLVDNQIRELEMDLPLSTSGYLECLIQSSGLTKLAINCSRLKADAAKEIISRLIPSVKQPPLCPKLRHLTLTYPRVDDELMLDLARSRMGIFDGMALLEVLQVEFYGFKSLHIEGSLDELREQGMQIRFDYFETEKRDRHSTRQQVAGDPYFLLF
ncbi:hypothetical protein VKT23_007324 [Stygiomarasmius scandens]|uniref:F-box domain-containing protein n=1 Tax=Marasmiellus scandens TaxID=2682957 RepID=A0ABR1JMT3_9AGAR